MLRVVFHRLPKAALQTALQTRAPAGRHQKFLSNLGPGPFQRDMTKWVAEQKTWNTTQKTWNTNLDTWKARQNAWNNAQMKYNEAVKDRIGSLAEDVKNKREGLGGAFLISFLGGIVGSVFGGLWNDLQEARRARGLGSLKSGHPASIGAGAGAGVAEEKGFTQERQEGVW